MEGAFAWIGQFFEWLIAWLPCTTTINETTAGVKFPWGGRGVELLHDNGMPLPRLLFWKKWRRTGLHWYWPKVTEEPETTNVKRTTCDLRNQSLLTTDGIAVGVSGLVVVEILNPLKALTECEDWGTLVREIAVGIVKETVNSVSFADLALDEGGALDDEMTRALRKELTGPYGVKVVKACLTDVVQLSRTFGVWRSDTANEEGGGEDE